MTNYKSENANKNHNMDEKKIDNMVANSDKDDKVLNNDKEEKDDNE